MLRRIIGIESDEQEVEENHITKINMYFSFRFSHIKFPQRLHVLSVHTFDPVRSRKEVLLSY
jgi:hypothetical protein